MSEGLVLMSGKEVDRLGLVRDVVEGRIRQRQAAEEPERGHFCFGLTVPNVSVDSSRNWRILPEFAPWQYVLFPAL